MSTDDRELMAWQEAVAHQHENGDVIFDDEDLSNVRAAL
jgi:hypothetical protein